MMKRPCLRRLTESCWPNEEYAYPDTYKKPRNLWQRRTVVLKLYIYALEVGRLNRLWLKCSSVSPKWPANSPEQENIILKRDAELILENLGTIGQVHSSRSCCSIIWTGVEIYIFQPISKKQIPEMLSWNIPGFRNVSNLLMKVGEVEILKVEQTHQLVFHTHTVLPSN